MSIKLRITPGAPATLEVDREDDDSRHERERPRVGIEGPMGEGWRVRRVSVNLSSSGIHDLHEAQL